MRSVVDSHGPGSNPRGNAICNAFLLQSFPVLQTFGLQYLDRHCPPSSDVLPLNLAQKLKISKSFKTGPDIAYRPEKFSGCPGQARTKPYKKSDQPSRHRRRLAGAAAPSEVTCAVAPPCTHPAACNASTSATHHRPTKLSSRRNATAVREGGAQRCATIAQGSAHRRNGRPTKLRQFAGDEARHLTLRGALRSVSSGARASDSDAILAASARPAKSHFNDEHVHLHHRDFIVTPITDQIGPIESVSKTEQYDLKNRFSEPQCKMTVLPLNSGKPRFDPC
ncbi:hypothetical protein F511_36923 [Dorcoceras hygrometricum]|uniref:Uncharacterized protein n=1 Tax=Dorcoceras hygrometricum TaxID=472368 RepID=A0A2Z7C2W8_9LAMI|nr:hypothetical protein F511_36923 [Dorcoceras hygrometricum]